MNEYEKFQFETLKDFALYDGWLERLILEFNWTKEQSESFITICDKYSNMKAGTYTYSDFEHELKNGLGVDYQASKIFIQVLHKNDVYNEIVHNCISSIRDKTCISGYMPSEFKSIERALFGDNQ